ncbi:MAG: glutamine--tRNA ligase/YqeY domain fusion protein [Planctomycetota bacterium]
MSTDAQSNNAESKDKFSHFIAQEIEADLAAGRYPHVHTRFPPEPNGYLHIGHAKAICIVFGLAQQFGGRCNLRLDDTNPAKEEQEYIDSIKEDVLWLGFDWANLCHASDYFDQLYDWAVALIKAGHAYVDDQTAEQIREHRGTLTRPGTPSPFRDRPPKESLDLLKRMKQGEFDEGSRVLRAKIDMASPNIVMRDPAMYRILKQPHPRTGEAWCIYPMYDWAHGQSDWIEGITHSLCSLEFKNNRELYNWFIERITEAAPPELLPGNGGEKFPGPRQIEFARGNITHLITSKRKLMQLISGGHVSGWDDPRMPTLRGMRRRGYTPEAIVRFWTEAGVAKRENNLEFAKLENVLRADLNAKAQRRMAVLDPIRVTITNLADDHLEWFDAQNNPEDEADGTRKVPFSKHLYIERSDYMPHANRKFFRLTEGREVRLRWAYWIQCNEAITDDAGNVVELKCTYDPETRGGESPPPDAQGNVRKVKGTIHWVSVEQAADVEVRLYEHLFADADPERPDADGQWRANVNPDSLRVVAAKAEPALLDDPPGAPLQFERQAYFVRDPADSDAGLPVFNRTVTLRDTWAKVQKKS